MMMRTSLQTFIAGIEELNAFLTDADRQIRLFGMLLQGDRLKTLTPDEQTLVGELSQSRTDRKRYMYAVAIISLYGLLERLVDDLIARYVTRISAIVPSYDATPDAIKKHHLSLSIEMVKAIIEERFHRGATEQQVIANLHSCVSGAKTFQVNGAAFALHRGNISLGKVSEYLRTVGIGDHFRKVLSSRAMLALLEKAEPERAIDKIADQDIAKILEPIDDLVERRNQVSHGVINVDDIESLSLLKERSEFVSAYGCALYEILFTELLGFELQTAYAQSLGNPLAVYRNAIVCFEHDSCKIDEGDILVAATPNAVLPYRFSPIISIEIDKVRHPSIDISTATRFGLAVSFHANADYEYYVLPKTMI